MGVSSEYGKLRKVLLCRPDYFKLVPTNDINKRALASGRKFTMEDVEKQHEELCDAFSSAGVEILFVGPRKDLPYQIHTRDLGTMTSKGVLLGRFRLPIRQSETDLTEEFFVSQGIPIFARISMGAFEGGDIHYIDNETIAVGIGSRSDMEGFDEAQAMVNEGLGMKLVAVELPGDPFFHLDCVFVRVNKHLCLAHTPALPDFFLERLKYNRIEIIELSAEECGNLNCNGVAIDEETFVSFRENERVNRELESFGIEVLKPSYSIITLSGGGPRCSCFPLVRDEV